MSSATAKCDFEFVGTLLENAQARVQDVNGHMVPVVCFVAQLETATGTICRGHQLFALGQDTACEKRAEQLRKGTRVRMQAPSVGVELVMHNVTHIHVLHDEAAPAAAAREAAAA